MCRIVAINMWATVMFVGCSPAPRVSNLEDKTYYPPEPIQFPKQDAKTLGVFIDGTIIHPSSTVDVTLGVKRVEIKCDGLARIALYSAISGNKLCEFDMRIRIEQDGRAKTENSDITTVHICNILAKHEEIKVGRYYVTVSLQLCDIWQDLGRSDVFSIEVP